MAEDRPLTVQSDRTMLLDVHSPSADMCRGEIIAFADLVKSPEHVHTYQISQLSLWNAISSGLTADEILRRLERWSRFDIDSRIIFYIKDQAERYGDFILTELDDEYLLLTVRRPVFALQLKAEQSLHEMLEPEDEKSFRVKRMMRGVLKARMIKLGFPVDDRIPLKKGVPLEIKLRNNFTPRPYQIEAVNALLGDGGNGTGYGTIVLPCGSGKTQMGIALAARIGRKTLWVTHTADLLTQSFERAEQYYPRELLGKITAGRVQIGSHLTFATVQTLSKLDLQKYKYTWDVIIVDECHRVSGTPSSMKMFYQVMSSLAARYKYGLSATVHRSDGLIKSTFAVLGNVKYQVPDEAVAEKTMQVRILRRDTGIQMEHWYTAS